MPLMKALYGLNILNMPPFPYIIVIEALCCTCGFIFLNKDKTVWKYFKWILLLIVLKEIVGYATVIFMPDKNNHWWFNIFLPVDFVIYTLIFHHSCKRYFQDKWLIILGFVCFTIIYGYESYQSSFLKYSLVASNIAAVYYLLFCCLYYFFLLKQEEYEDILGSPVFWIITGLFVFYFARTACNVFFTYLVEINEVLLKPVRYIIFIILGFILYGLWSYAFLCRYRQRISSL